MFFPFRFLLSFLDQRTNLYSLYLKVLYGSCPPEALQLLQRFMLCYYAGFKLKTYSVYIRIGSIFILSFIFDLCIFLS